jgi:hypothetical protein
VLHVTFVAATGLRAKVGRAVKGVDVRKARSCIPPLPSLGTEDKTELADIDIPNARIECQAFTRDRGVNESIWMNDR